MWLPKSYHRIGLYLLLCWGLLFANPAKAQSPDPDTTTLPPDVERPILGPYDTIPVPAKILDGTLVPAQTLGYIFVSAPAPPGMKERIEKWTRLRNAVYVTYPYARKAGNIMNDINARIAIMPDKHKRKEYIKSREKELKKEFADPLQQLSVYQGKVLMKLINRQAHNNCYDIIKEYKGGVTARFWQTIAFFFNSSLKQPYDATGEDKEIESIVMEVERMYGSR
jgi:Domain of unknown function (DUF4294)